MKTVKFTFTTVITLLLVIVLLISAIASDSMNEVFGVYGGDFSDSDMLTFCSNMEDHGYSQYTYSYEDSSPDLMYLAAFRDILYWSGHGWSNGNLSYNTANNIFNGPSEVGCTYDSSNYVSDSYWNYDLEWVIFAACNQMTGNARTLWARTMVGNNPEVGGSNPPPATTKSLEIIEISRLLPVFRNFFGVNSMLCNWAVSYLMFI